MERDYILCNWKELKANFKQECWKINVILKWTSNPNSLFAIAFCYCLSDFTHWGFDSTMCKKFVWIFDEDVITQKVSSNSEMYSCWDNERAHFSENCAVNFMVSSIYDNWKPCKNTCRNTHTYRTAANVKQQPEKWYLVWPMFTVENSWSNEFITIVNVKPKVQLHNVVV